MNDDVLGWCMDTTIKTSLTPWSQLWKRSYQSKCIKHPQVATRISADCYSKQFASNFEYMEAFLGFKLDIVRVSASICVYGIMRSISAAIQNVQTKSDIYTTYKFRLSTWCFGFQPNRFEVSASRCRVAGKRSMDSDIGSFTATDPATKATPSPRVQRHIRKKIENGKSVIYRKPQYLYMSHSHMMYFLN